MEKAVSGRSEASPGRQRASVAGLVCCRLWSIARLVVTAALLGVALTCQSTSAGSAAPLDDESCFAAVPLTADGSELSGKATSVDFTPDGRYLVYARQAPVAGIVRAVVRIDTSDGTTIRVDVAADGGEPDSGGWGPSITPDGRYVAFVSDATDLVAGDTNGMPDVFVRDITGGTTELVSMGQSDGGGTWGAKEPVRRRTDISSDGRFVVFGSERRLVAADTDDADDVFVRDRQTGVSVLASIPPAGKMLESGVDGTISGDGRYLAFLGSDDSGAKVYRRDLLSGVTELVNDSGASGPAPAINSDGRYVAFAVGFRVHVRDMSSATFWPLPVDDTSAAPAGSISITPSGSAVAYPLHRGLFYPQWVVQHPDGSRRVVLDGSGQPVDAVGFGLVDDGGSGIYLENRYSLPPLDSPVPARNWIEGYRVAVDRAGLERIAERLKPPWVEEIRQGETLPVDIFGFNLTADTSYSSSSGSLSLTDITLDPATAKLHADSDAPLGRQSLIVTAASGCSTEAVTVEVIDGTPEVTDISVSRLRPGTTVPVSISGQNLVCPCSVSLTGGIVTGAPTSAADGRSMSFSVTTPAFTADGFTDLSITNAFGRSVVVPGAMALHTTEGEFHGLTPARILDTRYGTGGPVGRVGQVARTVMVAGRGGVPAGGQARAVVMNVTVTEPTSPAFVTVWPAGDPLPLASNLNVASGQTVPNQVTVPLSATGEVNVYVSDGDAHVIFDVVGYYGSSTGSPGGRFFSVIPERLVDTREISAPLGPGETGTLEFGPSPYGALVLNVTVTDPTAAGYLTVTPSGPLPLASSLNFGPGQTIANLVTVRLGAANSVDFFNSDGDTHVVVDIVGIYGDDDTYLGDAAFRPLLPTRFLDTRIGMGAPTGKVGPRSALQLETAGRLGIPPDASAVAGNITATAGSAPSYLTVWPAGAVRPLTSNLNFGTSQTVPNAVVMALGASGELGIFNDSGHVDVIADLAGWFTPQFNVEAAAGALAVGGHTSSVVRPWVGRHLCSSCSQFLNDDEVEFTSDGT